MGYDVCAMSNKRKPMSPRTARERGLAGGSRREISPEEKLLRSGGWRALVINPGDPETGLHARVVFLNPSTRGFYTKEQAIEIEKSRPKPTGELLKKDYIPGHNDPESNLCWSFGAPPRAKPVSKRQRGLAKSRAKMGRDYRTGEMVVQNRAYRRRQARNG